MSLGLVTGRVCALGEALASVGGALSKWPNASGYQGFRPHFRDVENHD